MKKNIRSLLAVVMLLAMAFMLGSVSAFASDASVTMPDVTGSTLADALETLQEAGLENITSDASLTKDHPEAMWSVASQNVAAGEKISASAEITLGCTKLSQLTLSLKSKSNIFFNTYDMDLLLNGTKLETLSNGKTFSQRVVVPAGTAELTVTKTGSTEPTATVSIDTENHSSFRTTITHDKNEIAFSGTATEEMPYIQVLTVPDVSGMVVADAKATLDDMGFTDVRCYTSDNQNYNSDTWYVESQEAAAGTEQESNITLKLNLLKLSDYFSDTYVGKSLDEVLASDDAMGFNRVFYDNDTQESLELSDIPGEEQNLWGVDSAAQNGTERVINLYIHKRGTRITAPDVENLLVSDAKDVMSESGLTNVKFYTPNSEEYNSKQWVVSSQESAAGDAVYSNDPFKVHLITATEFFNDAFAGKTLEQALPSDDTLGFLVLLVNNTTGKQYVYDDIAEKLHLEGWDITEAAQNEKSKELLLYVTMRSGWFGKQYYDPSTGAMYTSWKQIDGFWYFFQHSTGNYVTGWKNIESYRYYFASDGKMATGWVQIDGEYYDFNDSGHMLTGWVTWGGKDFYLDTNGVMLHDTTQTINGTKYSFNSEGAASKVSSSSSSSSNSGTSSERMVWISDAGSKYHSRANCSGMKNPSKVTITQAQNMGYTACKKCC